MGSDIHIFAQERPARSSKLPPLPQAHRKALNGSEFSCLPSPLLPTDLQVSTKLPELTSVTMPGVRKTAAGAEASTGTAQDP